MVSCTCVRIGSACGRRNLVRALPDGYLHEFASLGENSAPVSANDGTDATSTGFTQGRRLQRGLIGVLAGRGWWPRVRVPLHDRGSQSVSGVV
jgi:hypothetical protein